MSEINFVTINKILKKEERRNLLVLSLLRVLANGLDLLGIAGVAILASAFGSFASGDAPLVSIPGFGPTYLSEYEAVWIALFVAFIFISKSGFSILLNLKASLYVAKIEVRISKQLARDFFQVGGYSKNAKKSVSDFQNIAMNSTGAIQAFINSKILFVAEGSLLLALLGIFTFVNPIATLGLTLFMGAILFLLNRLIRHKLTVAGEAQILGSRTSLQSARDLHGIRLEALTAGLLEAWLARFDEGREKMATSQAITFTLVGLPRYVIETALMLALFLFVGGIVIFSDIPSQAVTVGVFLAGGLRIMASIIPLQGAITGMRSSAATGRPAFQALRNSSRAGGNLKRPASCSEPKSSEIIFDNVDFSFDEDSRQVLKNVSFRIEPRTKVAIVGPSGAGKSTVFDLATGFLTPDRGKVLIGDQDARETLVQTPGYFGVVPQRPHLIAGTILENVSLLTQNEIDAGLVKEVLIRAGLEKITAEKDWETLDILPDSGQLSGGEIQRLSLARALYREPSILFLDEATSALDAETEMDVARVLDELKNDMTVVLIAHRLSTVRDADKLIYLDNGEILAEGTFLELTQKVEGFARAVDIMGLAD